MQYSCMRITPSTNGSTKKNTKNWFNFIGKESDEAQMDKFIASLEDTYEIECDFCDLCGGEYHTEFVIIDCGTTKAKLLKDLQTALKTFNK